MKVFIHNHHDFSATSQFLETFTECCLHVAVPDVPSSKMDEQQVLLYQSTQVRNGQSQARQVTSSSSPPLVVPLRASVCIQGDLQPSVTVHSLP